MFKKGTRFIRVKVDKGNQSAKETYKKLGYKVRELNGVIIMDGYDEIFEKELKASK